MDYKINNQQAIIEAEKTYGRLKDAEDFGNPNEIIHYLKILGLRCNKCGLHNISWNVLKFYNFDPGVTCYNCQHN